MKRIRVDEPGQSLPAKRLQQNHKKPLHPADAAGLMRYEFFQTDLWVVGGKEYVTPKNSVPPILEAAFAPSMATGPVPVDMKYDREKFSIDRLVGLEEGREYFAWVHSNETGKGVVDITLREDTFVVELFKGAHDQMFPFTKDEFLKALLAGKINVELDQLEVETESEEEKERR